MKDGRSVVFWLVTGLFCLMMAASGFLHLAHTPMIERGMQSLGYPSYFSSILGAAKIAGVAALLLPVPFRLKEWAYAGFAFDILGACWSHLAMGQSFSTALVILAIFIAAYAMFYVRTAKSQQGSADSGY